MTPRQSRITLLVIGLIALIIWIVGIPRLDRVASYDWGYECGYTSSYLYWEEWIESDRKVNFFCGENKKYEYWGSAEWRKGYRRGEVDGKRAYLRGNKKFCGTLPCDKEGAMQPTIDALTR